MHFHKLHSNCFCCFCFSRSHNELPVLGCWTNFERLFCAVYMESGGNPTRPIWDTFDMQRTPCSDLARSLFIFCLALVHYVFNYAFVHFTTKHTQAHMHPLSRKKVLDASSSWGKSLPCPATPRIRSSKCSCSRLTKTLSLSIPNVINNFCNARDNLKSLCVK